MGKTRFAQFPGVADGQILTEGRVLLSLVQFLGNGHSMPLEEELEIRDADAGLPAGEPCCWENSVLDPPMNRAPTDHAIAGNSRDCDVVLPLQALLHGLTQCKRRLGGPKRAVQWRKCLPTDGCPSFQL